MKTTEGAFFRLIAFLSLFLALNLAPSFAYAKVSVKIASRVEAKSAGKKNSPTKRTTKAKVSRARPEKMLSFAQWKSLSRSNQQLYLVGLQELALDFDLLDKANHVQYQIAQSDFLSSLIPEANAAESSSPKSCVYAGWVSEFDINGRFCMNPPQGSCKGHQVQCQPLLYGNGLCVSSGPTATQACTKTSKSMVDVAKDVVGHESEWNQLRKDLSDACISPKDTQIRVCEMLQARLAEMKNIVGPVKAEPEDESVKANRSRASAEDSDANRDTSDPVSTAESTTSNETTASGEIESGGSSGDSVPIKKGCVPHSLASPIDLVDQQGRPTSFVLMSLQTAQEMVCSTNNPSATKIKEWHDSISHQFKLVEKLEPKREKYYLPSVQEIQSNLDGCLSQSKQARADGHVLMDPGHESTIRFKENGNADISVTGGSPSLTSSAYAPLQMVHQNLSLCKMTIVDDLHRKSSGSSAGVPGAQ